MKSNYIFLNVKLFIAFGIIYCLAPSGPLLGTHTSATYSLVSSSDTPDVLHQPPSHFAKKSKRTKKEKIKNSPKENNQLAWEPQNDPEGKKHRKNRESDSPCQECKKNKSERK